MIYGILDKMVRNVKLLSFALAFFDGYLVLQYLLLLKKMAFDKADEDC